MHRQQCVAVRAQRVLLRASDGSVWLSKDNGETIDAVYRPPADGAGTGRVTRLIRNPYFDGCVRYGLLARSGSLEMSRQRSTGAPVALLTPSHAYVPVAEAIFAVQVVLLNPLVCRVSV